MHIVLLNQAFHPDIVATAQMSKDLADHLVARGHRVTAVASRSVYGKKGSVLPRRETIDGVEVRRVASSLFGKSSILLRALDFGFFYLLAAGRTLTLPKPDVVIGFTTPPFIALVGILARWFRGSKSVYWVMDLYPDVAVGCGVMKPTALPTRIFARINRWLLRRSDATVVLGRCMQQRVLDAGAPPQRVRFIPVWAHTEGLEPAPHDQNPFREQFGLKPGDCCVMYSGNWGIAHDADTICRAMQLIAGDPPRDESGAEVPVRFVFVGGGKRRAEVEAFIREHELGHIATYHDYVPRDKIKYSLSAGDIHLMTVREGLEGTVVPSKLFGIMAVARPGIYIGNPSSEIARILDESQAGVLAPQGDADALADDIRTLASSPGRRNEIGQNARNAVLTRYHISAACDQWAALIDSFASDPDIEQAPGKPASSTPETRSNKNETRRA